MSVGAHGRAVTVPTLGVRVADYVELTKPRITFMVVVSTAAGYYLGAERALDLVRMLHTLVGTALVASGASALNQLLERDTDALMHRTRNRPLPSRRLDFAQVLGFGLACVALGTLHLYLTVNALTSMLGLLTVALYVLAYTPLKRRSSLCTIVGAVPGALPPVMGWTAAWGDLSLEAWTLFAILFFWQLPHFMAISWIYREDYGRAGFVMTSVRDGNGTATARQAIYYSLALLAVSAIPTFTRMTGVAYLAGAILLGAAITAASVRFFFERNNKTAMKLFMTSNLYLIVMMLLFVISARS